MLKVGHRGARAYEPENTIRSFKKAIELGVDAVELDVRNTKDKQIVVIHDADVKRTTNCNGLVSDLTLAEIKNFVTEKEERLPTLEEALDLLDQKVKIFIEIKETDTEEQVLSIIKKKGLNRNGVVVSFLEEVLKKARELNPEIETGLIYAKHKDPVKTAIDLKAQWLLAFFRFAHTPNVQKAHENGLKVLVWTVNANQEVAEMIKKGVDAVATDKPDMF